MLPEKFTAQKAIELEMSLREQGKRELVTSQAVKYQHITISIYNISVHYLHHYDNPISYDHDNLGSLNLEIYRNCSHKDIPGACSRISSNSLRVLGTPSS